MNTPSCPVCLYDVPVAPACARCGWELSAGPWAGTATAEHEHAFADKLATARRSFDLTTAARASAGDQALLRRLATLVRGGTPDGPEIAAAAAPGEPPESAPAALAPAVAKLVAGEGTDTLTLVEVRLEGIAVGRLDVDDLGVPRPVGQVRLSPWESLLPALPADEDRRRMVLAGGIDPDTQARVGDRELAYHTAHATVLGQSGQNTVVLHRLPGWAIPDEVLEAWDLRPVNRRPVTGGGLADSLLAELVTRAPLRFGYGLVLVEVNKDGVTRPVVHPLFPAGSAASGERVAVTVEAPATTGTPLVAAIVGGPAGSPPRHRQPVAVHRVSLTAKETHRLEFVLDGPGQVSLHRPAGEPDQVGVDTWPDVLDDIPSVYRPATEAMDLAFTVELGGTAEAVARRVDLVTQVIQEVEERHPEPESVRVGIVGYHDHRAHQRTNVLVSHPFSPLREALEFAGGLAASPQIEPWAAPLEDALWDVVRLRWRRRPAACRLVIVGSRVPHPDEPRGDTAGCPHRYSVTSRLKWLDDNEVHRVAVWDPPSVLDREPRESALATSTWRSLARPRQPLPFDRTNAALLATEARAVGSGPPPNPLLFPLSAHRTTPETPR